MALIRPFFTQLQPKAFNLPQGWQEKISPVLPTAPQQSDVLVYVERYVRCYVDEIWIFSHFADRKAVNDHLNVVQRCALQVSSGLTVVGSTGFMKH